MQTRRTETSRVKLGTRLQRQTVSSPIGCSIGTKIIANRISDRGALYVWGGIGKPLFRPFYRYLVEVELDGDFLIANHITWKKKRAYGVQHNYLFTREECAYLHKGIDIKKPRVFNVPLLDKLRGYAGYDPDHPAKSEFLRRTSVWDDITEIFRGKMHETQKPVAIVEIPIQVHTNKGMCVLDPFAGSGTTAIAARKNDRQFVVVEKDPDIFELMVSRIRSGSLADVVPGLVST
jgi:DNA modification methylase